MKKSIVAALILSTLAGCAGSPARQWAQGMVGMENDDKKYLENGYGKIALFVCSCDADEMNGRYVKRCHTIGNSTFYITNLDGQGGDKLIKQTEFYVKPGEHTYESRGVGASTYLPVSVNVEAGKVYVGRYVLEKVGSDRYVESREWETFGFYDSPTEIFNRKISAEDRSWLAFQAQDIKESKSRRKATMQNLKGYLQADLTDSDIDRLTPEELLAFSIKTINKESITFKDVANFISEKTGE